MVANKGLVVIEVDEPGLAVTVEENKVAIQDQPGQREITLPAGPHHLDVTVKDRSGRLVALLRETFTLERGGKRIVDVHRQMTHAQFYAAPDAIIPGTAPHVSPAKQTPATKQAPVTKEAPATKQAPPAKEVPQAQPPG